MTLGLSLLLGLVQGLTEFLPVSSSGHLVLVRLLSGIDLEANFVFFDLMLHLGTLIAVVAAFWPDVKKLVVAFFQMIGDGFRLRDSGERRLILLIVIATLPMFALVPFKDWIEGLFSSPYVVGCALLGTALLLFLSERMPAGHKSERTMRPLDALLIGCMQALAVIPGLSRSGSTLTGGLFRGLSRPFAVKFAFLICIPAVLGANVLNIPDAVHEIGDLSLLPIYLAGVAVAAVSGFFAIRLVQYLSRRGGFRVFGFYCALVGVVTLILTALA